MIDIKKIRDLVKAAGYLANSYIIKDLIIKEKPDHTFVSNADEEINEFLIEKISEISPSIPVISEESSGFPPFKETFWLVDPIDYTNNFIKGMPEYTINIGLIQDNIPKYGFIYYPARDLLYYTNADKKVIKEQNGIEEIFSNKVNNERNLKLLTTDNDASITKFASNNHIHDIAFMSNVVRLGKVFEGSFDIYATQGYNMEWDTAAWHALFLAMGGDILDQKGVQVKYGKPEFLNPYFFACNQKALNLSLKWL